MPRGEALHFAIYRLKNKKTKKKVTKKKTEKEKGT